jgi:enediyne biosynthesis protein E4
VTGSVFPEVERKLPRHPYKTSRVVFRNLSNATFEKMGASAGEGITTPHSSRGCAFGDFDNDGDLDVLIINMNEPPSLLRNARPSRLTLMSTGRTDYTKLSRKSTLIN